MVKLNNPMNDRNGELAMWVDGVEIIHLGKGFPDGRWIGSSFYTPRKFGDGVPFEGFLWRSVPELVINYLWLSNYVDSDPGCSIWLDDIVLARQYIGPMVDTSATGMSTSKGRASLERPSLSVRPGLNGNWSMHVESGALSQYRIQVFSVSGQKVWETSRAKATASADYSIEKKGLCKGQYFALLTDGSTRIACPFVIWE
jgi:hypothetical protein